MIEDNLAEGRADRVALLDQVRSDARDLATELNRARHHYLSPPKSRIRAVGMRGALNEKTKRIYTTKMK